MQSMLAPRKPAARCDQATAQHADLETGSRAEMSILRHVAIQAAGSHDQADGRAGDHNPASGPILMMIGDEARNQRERRPGDVPGLFVALPMKDGSD
jgi:hypothetical protein